VAAFLESASLGLDKVSAVAKWSFDLDWDLGCCPCSGGNSESVQEPQGSIAPPGKGDGDDHQTSSAEG
jgi:hypothetical protein